LLTADLTLLEVAGATGSYFPPMLSHLPVVE
jgi:hypothetical protein